jgi:hypothetical protein
MRGPERAADFGRARPHPDGRVSALRRPAHAAAPAHRQDERGVGGEIRDQPAHGAELAQGGVSVCERASEQRHRAQCNHPCNHRVFVHSVRVSISTAAPRKPNRLPNSTWTELRTAHASGIGLRELARNAGIPAGTVLARAKREGWTARVQSARTLAQQASAPDVGGAVALSMAERGRRHLERMGGHRGANIASRGSDGTRARARCRGKL